MIIFLITLVIQLSATCTEVVKPCTALDSDCNCTACITGYIVGEGIAYPTKQLCNKDVMNCETLSLILYTPFSKCV